MGSMRLTSRGLQHCRLLLGFFTSLLLLELVGRGPQSLLRLPLPLLFVEAQSSSSSDEFEHLRYRSHSSSIPSNPGTWKSFEAVARPDGIFYYNYTNWRNLGEGHFWYSSNPSVYQWGSQRASRRSWVAATMKNITDEEEQEYGGGGASGGGENYLTHWQLSTNIGFNISTLTEPQAQDNATFLSELKVDLPNGRTFDLLSEDPDFFISTYQIYYNLPPKTPRRNWAAYTSGTWNETINLQVMIRLDPPVRPGDLQTWWAGKEATNSPFVRCTLWRNAGGVRYGSVSLQGFFQEAKKLKADVPNPQLVRLRWPSYTWPSNRKLTYTYCRQVCDQAWGSTGLQKERLAEIRTQDEWELCEDLLAAANKRDAWIALENWGETNATSGGQDLLCWVPGRGDPNLNSWRADDCRSNSDGSQFWSRNGGCAANNYCKSDSDLRSGINEQGNRWNGITAMRIARTTTPILDAFKEPTGNQHDGDDCVCQLAQDPFKQNTSPGAPPEFMESGRGDSFSQPGGDNGGYGGFWMTYDMVALGLVDPPPSRTAAAESATNDQYLVSNTTTKSAARTATALGDTATPTESRTLSVLPTSSATASKTQPPTATPSLPPTATLELTASPSLSFTDGTPSETLTLTLSDNTVSLPLTTTNSLGTPSVTLIYPPEGTLLSEKAVVTGRNLAAQRIVFLSGEAEWNCKRIKELIRDSPNQLFKSQVAPSTGPNPEGTENSFLPRIGTLLGGGASGVTCNRWTLIFQLQRDKEYAIRGQENITVTLNDADMLLPHPTIDPRLLDISETVLVEDNKAASVITIPKAVVESAKASATASTAVGAAAGNPAVAVQASRTALILGMANCEDNTEEGMGFMEHPVGVDVGTGIVGPWAGAAFYNPIVVMGSFVVHGLLSWIAARIKMRPIWSGFSKLYFPSLQALVILPLLQPTATGVTTVFRQSTQFSQMLAAAWGAFFCVLFLVYIVYISLPRWGFRAKFVKYPKEGPGARNRLRVFMTGPGEYVDNYGEVGQEEDEEKEDLGRTHSSNVKKQKKKSKEIKEVSGRPLLSGGLTSEKAKEYKAQKISFVKMHFLYFDLYRIKRVWFGIGEMSLTVLFGVVEGWRPSSDSGCSALVLIMTALFVAMFFAVIILRPYVSKFEGGMAVSITFIQAVGAICTSIYALSKVPPVINMGAIAATAGLYVLTVKAAVDLVVTIYDTILDMWMQRQAKKEERKKRLEGLEEGSGSDDDDDEMALLEERSKKPVSQEGKLLAFLQSTSPENLLASEATKKAKHLSSSHHLSNPLLLSGKREGKINPLWVAPPPPPGPPPGGVLLPPPPPPGSSSESSESGFPPPPPGPPPPPTVPILGKLPPPPPSDALRDSVLVSRGYNSSRRKLAASNSSSGYKEGKKSQLPPPPGPPASWSGKAPPPKPQGSTVEKLLVESKKIGGGGAPPLPPPPPPLPPNTKNRLFTDDDL